jgi:hypothetical protein
MEAKLLNKVKPSSARLYIGNLSRVGIHNEKDLELLKDVPALIKSISHYAVTTRKTYVSSIVTVLDQYPEYHELTKAYKKVLAHEWESFRVQRPDNEKTARQKKFWISWKNVKSKVEEVKDKNSIEYLVGCLYTMIEPRRNMDYLLMTIGESSKENNWYVDGKFVFNRYKTSDEYGQQVMEVPENLRKVIDDYIGKRTSGYLLMSNGRHLHVNGITLILNSVFGTGIGCSMLRTIYLTEKYGENYNERKIDAEHMAHSLATQNKYIRLDHTSQL